MVRMQLRRRLTTRTVTANRLLYMYQMVVLVEVVVLWRKWWWFYVLVSGTLVQRWGCSVVEAACVRCVAGRRLQGGCCAVHYRWLGCPRTMDAWQLFWGPWRRQRIAAISAIHVAWQTSGFVVAAAGRRNPSSRNRLLEEKERKYCY